jgi:Ca2+-binding RTX toxin-like protein
LVTYSADKLIQATGSEFSLDPHDELIITTTGILFARDDVAVRLSEQNRALVEGAMFGLGHEGFSDGDRANLPDRSGGGHDITIGSRGLVMSDADHAILIMHGAASTINNAGTISAISGIAVRLDRGRVINSGTILGEQGIEMWDAGGTLVYNAGLISATADAVSMHAPTRAKVTNLAGAVISGGETGVSCEGSAAIRNAGLISSHAGGGVAMVAGSLHNRGTVDGQVAIRIAAPEVPIDPTIIPGVLINNSGLITGRSYAIDGAESGVHINLVNDGRIIGNILLSGGLDYVLNRGTIAGSVELGGGSDFYDGRGGSVTKLISGQDGRDQIAGGYGDSLSGGAGNDWLLGAAGANALDGGSGDDLLAGGSGGDRLLGGSGLDRLVGGSGDDELSGAAGRDNLSGGFGDDRLIGGRGIDRMSGGGGDDTYGVDDGRDRVFEAEGGGIDTVWSSTSYTASSHVENLVLTGADHANATGNAAPNAITGNRGGNTINGRGGSDELRGGAGADRFVFDTELNAFSNVDWIMDFSVTEDRIQLQHSIFGELSPYGVRWFEFHTGTAAHDSDDRLIYNRQSGEIFYDADGSGSVDAVLFATVQPGLALTNSHFSVIGG